MLNRAASRLRTLGEPYRLGTLPVLKRGALTVGRVLEALDGNQPNVSRHVQILYETALCNADAKGAVLSIRVIAPVYPGYANWSIKMRLEEQTSSPSGFRRIKLLGRNLLDILVSESQMRIRSIATKGIVAAITFVLIQSPARAQSALPLAATTIPSAQLIPPEELKTILNSTRAVQPLILQVGSRVMFDQAHIPASEYAGPGSHEDALHVLRDRVKTLAKSRFIVLYCGCCPWNRCPNVGNAYKTLCDLGFTNVKVLYIADNFGSDWVSKGYPVAH